MRLIAHWQAGNAKTNFEILWPAKEFSCNQNNVNVYVLYIMYYNNTYSVLNFYASLLVSNYW